MMNYKCIECDEPGVWILHTGFVGDVPYCEAHAIEHGLKDSDEWKKRKLKEGEKKEKRNERTNYGNSGRRWR